MNSHANSEIIILTTGRFANLRQAPRQHFNPPYDVPLTWITFLLKTNERTFVHVTLISSRKKDSSWLGLEEWMNSRERQGKSSRIINLRSLMIADEKLETIPAFFRGSGITYNINY